MTAMGTPPDDTQPAIPPGDQPPVPAPADAQPAVSGVSGTLSPDGRWVWDGTQWQPAPPTPPPPGYGAPPGHYPPPGYGAPYPAPPMAAIGPAPGLLYAGFWIRLLASFIDGLILIVPVVIVSVASGGFVKTDEFGGTTINGGAYGLTILVELAYFLGCWGALSRTPGMMALNMRIVRVENGAPIDFAKAAVRLVGFVISYVPFCLGLIWAGFDPRKQGWHDKIAGTLVVRAV